MWWLWLGRCNVSNEIKAFLKCQVTQRLPLETYRTALSLYLHFTFYSQCNYSCSALSTMWPTLKESSQNLLSASKCQQVARTRVAGDSVGGHCLWAQEDQSLSHSSTSEQCTGKVRLCGLLSYLWNKDLSAHSVVLFFFNFFLWEREKEILFHSSTHSIGWFLH